MEKEDIIRLGHLARIKINDNEVEALQHDITAVLAYVSVVNEIASQGEQKAPGALHNVFREDVATNEPGSYTEAILAEAPQVERSMLVVKKILNHE